MVPSAVVRCEVLGPPPQSLEVIFFLITKEEERKKNEQVGPICFFLMVTCLPVVGLLMFGPPAGSSPSFTASYNLKIFGPKATH